MFACEYCNKQFGTNSNLKSHQLKTKYCLQLQNKNIDKTCEYCNKKLSIRYVDKHKCHEKDAKLAILKLEEIKEQEEFNNKKLQLIQQADEYKKETERKLIDMQIQDDLIRKHEIYIRELETKLQMKEEIINKYEGKLDKQEEKLLEKLSTVSNVTTNNTTQINNNLMLSIPQDILEEKAKLYTVDHWKKGEEGTAIWIADNLSDMFNYHVVDNSRRKFEYVINGERGIDLDADKMKSLIQPPLIPIMDQIKNEKVEQLDQNDSDYCQQSANLNKRNNKIKNMNKLGVNLVKKLV